MKLISTILIFLLLFVFSIDAKSKVKSNSKISLPQIHFPSAGGSAINPSLNPFLYNSPAYGNLILNQYNANMDAIISHIPQPQTDIGSQFLDTHIQKEISNDISVQPIQSGSSMPVYRITNIIDHGRANTSNYPKFKNVDYLLWKFQDIEEGNSILIKGNQLEFGTVNVFVDKPDSLLNFIKKEKDNFFLLESRVDGVLTGLLVNGRTKKVTKVQCTKQKETTQAIYEYAVIGEEVEFWNYLGLFGK